MKIKKTKIAIVGVGLERSISPGMAIPALVLFKKFQQMELDYDFKLIGMEGSADLKKKKHEIESSDIIIINSLATFLCDGSESLLMLINNKKVFLYLHETDYVIDYSHKTHPEKMTHFWKSLPFVTVLCSTRCQQDFYLKLGLSNVSVIYNSLFLREDYSWRRNRVLGDKIKVLMIGSIQERKGPKLFNEVADILGEHDQRFSFTWIGKKTDRQGGNFEFSNSVEWVNGIDAKEIHSALEDADIFFLSSIDDPLPLSATEAAAAGLRVVAFKSTGTRETLQGCHGFSSFTKYTADDAISSILQVITDFQNSTNFTRASKLFSPEKFALRAIEKITSTQINAPLFFYSPLYPDYIEKLNQLYGDNVNLLLLMYGLPIEAISSGDNTITRWINSKINAFDLSAIIDDYSVRTKESITEFEIFGVAKLLLIYKRFDLCIQFILFRMNWGISTESCVDITLAAINSSGGNDDMRKFIGRIVLPMISDSINSTRANESIYYFGFRLFLKAGFPIVADRFLSKLSDLYPERRPSFESVN